MKNILLILLTAFSFNASSQIVVTHFNAEWNDPNNANWYEQFITVLNATLISTNKFGKPTASKTINAVQNDDLIETQMATISDETITELLEVLVKKELHSLDHDSIISKSDFCGLWD